MQGGLTDEGCRKAEAVTIFYRCSGNTEIIKEMGQYERQEGRAAVFQYCALIMVVLISLSYGCSSPAITQEKTIQELNALVRSPNIKFNYARFYHQGNQSVVSIQYKNAGTSPAYSIVTDLKVYLDAHDVPIEQDSIRIEPTLAPNAKPRELRGILPEAFFEKVMSGKSKLTMEFGAQYQNEQGKQFESFSIWQFSRITMEPFLVEEKLNVAVPPPSKS